MKVFLERDEKTIEISLKNINNIEDLLKHLNINPVTVVVTKNNEVSTEQEKITSKDNIKIISVVSGG
ncbi:hypothetical protein HOF78_01365 [Candidatus Woesearchaeota archaeon]|nr:hypothetical protein [Candidatus Woesearchaeota archaeon]MBT6044967.1 hypothetical protein [Candidatus Woesearchaeota archaeon]